MSKSSLVETILQRLRAEIGLRADAAPGAVLPVVATAQVIATVSPPTVSAAARRMSATGANSSAPDELVATGTLFRSAPGPGASVSLASLLASRGDAFVDNAYLAILLRLPDVQGRSHYLSSLASGRLTRISFLGALRYSTEGRKAGANVPGLAFRFALDQACQLPLLGWVFRSLQSLAGLPALARSVETLADDQTRIQVAEAAAMQGIQAAVARQHANEVAHAEAQTRIAGELATVKSSLVEAITVQAALTPQIDELRAAFEVRTVVTEARMSAAEARMTAAEAHTAAAEASYQLLVATTQQLEREQGVSRAQLTSEFASQLSALEQRLQRIEDAIAQQTRHDAEALRVASVELEQLRLTNDELERRFDRLTESLDQQSRLASDALELRLTGLTESTTEQLTVTLQPIAAELAKVQDTNLQLALRTDQLLESSSRLAVDIEAVSSQTRSMAEVDLQRRPDEQFDRLNHAVNQLNTFKAALQGLPDAHGSLKLTVLDQERRLGLLLEEARKRLPAPLQVDQLTTMADEADHMLDAFYVSFEDRFRGTRADIKSRVSVYLDYVSGAKVGTAAAPVLDLGCGRGEWLEVLHESGFVARGVDQNRVMIQQCRDRDFEVIEADALTYVRGIKPGSIGAITGIHIIEHIPFRRLVDLLDAALLALRPGGLIIFETPNPENLIVGACNFYYDPTHLNPLPPDLMKFLAEGRGFVRPEILRLHAPNYGLTADTALNAFLLDRFTGAADYAVIAHKA